MKKLITICLLLCMLLGVVQAVHASPFTVRQPSVTPGTIAIYDVWLGQSHYNVKMTIQNVTGTSVGLLFNWMDDNNNPLFNMTQYLNVAGYTYAVPPWVIAGGLNGGPEYPGNALTLHLAIFGHIVFGQWRSTLWTDSSDPNFGIVNHAEFDKQTGLLIKYEFSQNDFGEAVVMKYTNAWGSSPFWFAMAIVVFWFNIIVPIALIAFAWYLFGFIIIGLLDYFTVRSKRKSAGPKMGNMMWFQIKIMIIAILLTMVIISVFFIVLRMLLR